MNYTYYVYQKRQDRDYSNDDIIYNKVICTQSEVARYVEQLNNNKRLQALGYNFYFMRII